MWSLARLLLESQFGLSLAISVLRRAHSSRGRALAPFCEVPFTLDLTLLEPRALVVYVILRYLRASKTRTTVVTVYTSDSPPRYT